MRSSQSARIEGNPAARRTPGEPPSTSPTAKPNNWHGEEYTARGAVQPLAATGVSRGYPLNTVDLTASRHVFPVATFMADNGEPLQPLFERAGLPDSCLAAIWRFRELAAMRSGFPNLTLAVMAPLALAELGAVAQSLLGAPTLLRTIQDFRRLAHSESSTANLDLTPYGNRHALFSVRFSLSHQPGQWQAELCLLMWMLKIVRLVDPKWSPTEIWCTAGATCDRLRAIESLATRPRFNQRCTGFPIPFSMLVLPQERCERRAEVDEAVLWSTAPSDSASGAVKQLIQAYAEDRWMTLAEASDALGVNARTLQRRLAVEDKTYSALLQETRAEVAGHLLDHTDASLSEIARLLGYSDLSNFNRAFRRWAATAT